MPNSSASEAVAGRMAYARRWLETFAPEDLRFEVQGQLPPQAAELDEDQRRFLGRLADELLPGMDGQGIHELIWKLAGEFERLTTAELFRAIYLVLLGKTRGPRAGSFLTVLDREFVLRRFNEAARAGS